jgi:hypothetical protein
VNQCGMRSAECGMPTAIRGPMDMRHSPDIELSFPLSLTPSPRERKKPAPGACFADSGLANSAVAIAGKRWTILPLPQREGGSG